MILKKLYVQVLLAVALGALLGHFVPAFAVQLKVLSDILVRLIEMILAPVIFCTIVLGIARMSDLKELGSIANHIIGRASRALRPATCRIARRRRIAITGLALRREVLDLGTQRPAADQGAPVEEEGPFRASLRTPRNCVGVLPVARLNVWAKWLGLL